VKSLGVEVRVLGDKDLCRFAGHEAGDQEVEAYRRPQCDGEKAQPSKDEPHMPSFSPGTGLSPVYL
jgi:hypothetical protein